MKILVNSTTRKPITVGMKTKDFRGDKCVVTGSREPHHEGSTGRVYLKYGKYTGEYFPGVINAEWVEVAK